MDNAASIVCRLLQCTNTDIVSTVLRHISECEVSPAILFCAKGLCAIQVGGILCNTQQQLCNNPSSSLHPSSPSLPLPFPSLLSPPFLPFPSSSFPFPPPPSTSLCVFCVTLKTCTLSLFESKHSVAAMQAYSSSAHATEGASLGSATISLTALQQPGP